MSIVFREKQTINELLREKTYLRLVSVRNGSGIVTGYRYRLDEQLQVRILR